MSQTLALKWSRSRRRSELDESGMIPGRYAVLSALGATLRLVNEDGDVRECTDLMSAYGSVNFGHCNPDIRRPDPAVDVVGCLYPPEADWIADWLCSRLKLPDYKVLFQVGGSFAVATGVALAQRHRPGRVLSVHGSFHGLGVDALALTDIHRAAALQCTPWSTSGQPGVDRIEVGAFPDTWEGVCALIVEPVQGANGYVPLPAPWLVRLTAAAREHGVLVIADEIQSGFFRHGHLSVARGLGIEPDIMLFSKSLTNGRYPLSAVVYRSSLVDPADVAVRLSHTFQTGAEGFRAAWAVAEYIDTHPVRQYCESVAGVLHRASSRLTARGAMDCFVSGPTLSFRMPGGSARQLVGACFARGVLPFTGGRSGERVRVAPPITISVPQLRDAVEVLLSVVDQLAHDEERTPGPAGTPRITPRITKREFGAFFSAFLRAHHATPMTTEPGHDTDLFDAGLLDSLRLIELIVAIEEFVQAEVPMEGISVRSFRTSGAIWEKVIEPLTAGRPPA